MFGKHRTSVTGWATERYRAFCEQYARIHAPLAPFPSARDTYSIALSRDIYDVISTATDPKMRIQPQAIALMSEFVSEVVRAEVELQIKDRDIPYNRVLVLNTAMRVVEFANSYR